MPDVLRRALRTVAVVAVAALVATACATEAGDDPFGRASDGSAPIEPDAGTPEGTQTELSADEVADAAVTEAEAWWRETFPKAYGQAWRSIQGGYWPYGPTTELPRCGRQPLDYEDIAGNAFYCPQSDLVAWDSTTLIPQLYQRFGAFTLGIVFVHEMSHAAQARAEVSAPTVVLELQADCFAGAWTAEIENGRRSRFRATTKDLDASVAGFLELRDGIGTSANDPRAHGTGFDRVGTFQDGYQRGAQRCVRYPNPQDQPGILEFGFNSFEDRQRGGNLPLEQIKDLAHTELEDNFGRLFGQLGRTWDATDAVRFVNPATDEVRCGNETLRGQDLRGAAFYCAPTDTVVVDDGELVPRLYEIGDFAVATEMGLQWAVKAQTALRIDSEARGARLQADCLVGMWAATNLQQVNIRATSRKIVLSPGDLDEALVAFLAHGRGDDDAGSAFERTDAFRSGFLETVRAGYPGGISACSQHVPLR